MQYYIFTINGGEPKVTGIRTGTGQAWFGDDFWKNNIKLHDFMWGKNNLKYCEIKFDKILQVN